MKTAIKICGITRGVDAKLALENGAQYLGLIFVPGSRRYVSPGQARFIIDEIRQTKFVERKDKLHLPAERSFKIVGVFQNAPLSHIQNIIMQTGIDMVQLHGEESPQLCEAINLPVIKAIELDVEDPPSLLRQYDKVAEFLLFDRPKASNKAGQEQGWLSRAISFLQDKKENLNSIRYFFAGGLDHTNVSDVLSALSPYGVDVASSIESQPGIKDKSKLEQFCQSVHSGVE